MPHPAFETEELLEEVGWVRALALQVARDPHVADDLTQDALLVAWSTGSERPRSARRWLATVVRNLSRTMRRGEQRRAHREQATGRPEVLPSTLELVERADTQRALVGAVLELDEPYRTTLLLRYFEDRSPREIAERMHLSESTVATRTAEGLRRVRSRLARDGGDGPRAWLPSLLPLLRWPKDPSVPAALTGALTVSLQTKLIIGTVAVVGAFFGYRALVAPDPLRVEPTTVGAPSEERLVAPDSDSARAPVGSGATARIRAAPASVPAEEREAPAEPVLHGRVIDLDGQPVPHVDITVRRLAFDVARHQAAPEEPLELSHTVTSDARGAFPIEVEPPFQLTARSDVYASVFEGIVHSSTTEREPTVIVARRVPLGGVVVDEAGRGVGGAVAVVLATGRLPRNSGNVLGASRRVKLTTHCDEQGRFDFEDAADLGGADVYVNAAGFVDARVPVPEGGDTSLRIVLSRSGSAYAIVGHVVLPDGSAAEDALVGVGTMTVRTDADGSFALDFEPALSWMDRDEPLRLAAGRPGFQPAILALPSIAEAEETGWPADIVLTLGGPPLTIRGRVVDEAGSALFGISVSALDTTRFGIVMEEDFGGGRMRTLEEIAGGGSTLTDKGGEFELRGLLDRSYRIEVMEKPSLLTTVTEPYAAGGPSVRVVLDRGALGRIAGRIVDREGTGIAGVRVAVSRKGQGRLEIGVSDTTDSGGRFALEGVTTEPPFLWLEGEAIVPELFRELPEDADVTALELQVSRRCQLQVDFGDWPGRADELRVVADGDLPIELVNLEGGRIGIGEGLTVEAGLSPVVALSETATQAILLLEGEEVTRFTLRLVPGAVTLLEL